MSDSTPTPERLREILTALRDFFPETPARKLPVTTERPLDELVLTILSQSNSDPITARTFGDFKERFPTMEDALEAGPEAIRQAISYGGLSNQKSVRIWEILRNLKDERGSLDLDFLREMDIKDAVGWLTSLNGVGRKTAACVLLFAFGKPVFPVDTHVHRVALRLGLFPPKTPPDRVSREIESLVDPEEVFPLHMLMIHLGREICHSRSPRCAICPLAPTCPSAV
jgi:endonuclease-3